MKIQPAVKITHWVLGTEVDIAAIARLISELGYPVDAAKMSKRLDRLLEISQLAPTAMIVARDETSNEIVGLVQIVIPIHLAHEMDVTAEISALIVDSAWRSRGIGDQLMDAAEQWARERGIHSIFLRTNEARLDAHRFYERQGFEHTKTSRMYFKTLSSDIKD